MILRYQLPHNKGSNVTSFNCHTQEQKNMIRILLVDDLPEFLEITRIFLEKEGNISVDTSESAEGALELLRERKYDAVVSDYEMPEMNGIEFLEEFKKQGIDKPFIIFTGRSREDVVINALNTGADFYLQKMGDPTIQFAELRNMIQQAVMRKRVETALIKSEINYRNIIESTEDSIYMVDKNCRYLFMNNHHQQRLGITGDYEGRDYRDFHTQEESEIFDSSIKQCVETGTPMQVEYSHGDRWFIRKMSPVRNDTLERYYGVTVVSTEVTERRRMEEALRLSEEKYRILIEATQDSVYTVDKEGRYMFMNSHHKRRIGIEGDDYLMKSYGEFHTPEETERFSGFVRDVVESKKFHEDNYKRNGGTYIRKMYPIFDKSGENIISVAVISIDVKEN